MIVYKSIKTLYLAAHCSIWFYLLKSKNLSTPYVDLIYNCCLYSTAAGIEFGFKFVFNVVRDDLL